MSRWRRRGWPSAIRDAWRSASTSLPWFRHSSLSSTRYALAETGREYVVFQPDDGGIAAELPTGTYDVEWFSLADREWTNADAIAATEAESTRLSPPGGAAGWVLHLSRQG